jgi:hypothetical protein
MSQTYTNSIFRQQAIDNLNNVDDEPSKLIIVSPSKWLWLLAILLTLMAMFTWGLLGTVSLTIEGQGTVITAKQLIEIERSINKTIGNHQDNVRELRDLYNKKIELYKAHYLTRIDIMKAKEDYIAAKEKLEQSTNELSADITESTNLTNTLIPSDTTITLTFVSYKQGKKIIPGMNALILPTTDSEFEKGYITGQVIAVSESPITKPFAYAYLHNMSLVDTFFMNGAPFMVKIKLTTPLPVGTAITAKIKYRTCSPLQLLSHSHRCGN